MRGGESGEKRRRGQTRLERDDAQHANTKNRPVAAVVVYGSLADVVSSTVL